MAWYRIEMEADDYTAIEVEVPNEHCDAVEVFMEKCQKEAESIPAWIGGHWTLHGPYATKEQAMDGWISFK